MTEPQRGDEPPAEPGTAGVAGAGIDATPLRRPSARRLVSGLRTRIIASYVILLSLAALASVLAVRQVLLVRLDDRIRSSLDQEAREFRRLVGGVDPRTGERFDDAERIFDLYLKRNVLGEGEQVITVPRGGEAKYLASARASEFAFADPYISRWRRLEQVERGEIDTAAGPVRYLAVPLKDGERTLGSFVAANFIQGERDQVAEAVRVVAVVVIAVMLLGSVVASSIAGRVLVPLRKLRDGARSVSGTQMDRRIGVEGDDEIAELGHTFNRMLDRLEVAFASQREFIRDVSHELRTPIAISRGHLELLAEGHLSDERDRREAVSLVVGELDRMNRFVEDLLLLAKSESPNFLELETTRLDELSEELLAKARGMAARHWKLDEASRRSIVADRQRVTQAVMNLVQNAIAHTDPGAEIAIGSRADGDEAVIWVRDTGPGIPASEQSRIFQRFSRGLHSRDSYDGTGIGLAIVRAIAEAHGGRVGVRSRPGEGATFELFIPVEQEDPAEAWEVGR